MEPAPAAPLEPTFACSPPPGVARVEVVVAVRPRRFQRHGRRDGRAVVPRRVARRLPEGYRPRAADGWAAGLRQAAAPVVALMDVRSDVDPRELERVAEPVARGSADLVLGRGAHGVVVAAGRRQLLAELDDAALAALLVTDTVRELGSDAPAGWRTASVPVRRRPRPFLW